VSADGNKGRPIVNAIGKTGFPGSLRRKYGANYPDISIPFPILWEGAGGWALLRWYQVYLIAPQGFLGRVVVQAKLEELQK
jgi:hypothetical protein